MHHKYTLKNAVVLLNIQNATFCNAVSLPTKIFTGIKWQKSKDSAIKATVEARNSIKKLSRAISDHVIGQ